MEQSDNNPYDFIMDPPGAKSRFGFGGGSQKQKILRVLILVCGLLLIFGGGYALLSSIGKKQSEQMYQLAAQQIDLSELIDKNSRDLRTPELINKSTTLSAIITSQSQDTNSFLSKFDPKKGKKIKSYRNTKFDKVLNDAKARGKFEESYSSVLANRLDAYKTLLRSIYASTDNKKLKKMAENYHSQLSVVTDS